MTCMPTGRPSTDPAGIETAGIAGQVGRHGECAVVAEGPLEAELAMRSTSPILVGIGPGGVEGDVGVGGGEDEVDLLEEIRHCSLSAGPGTARPCRRLCRS